MQEPFRFSFFQAVHLLQRVSEECSALGAAAGNPEDEIIRVSNDCSLSFPASQTQSITAMGEDESSRVRIETTLMGLYGVLSPLPSAYTASLIGEQEEGLSQRQAQREFLDLFNHRLHSLACRLDDYRLLHRDDAATGKNYIAEAVMALMGLALDKSNIENNAWKYSALTVNRFLSMGTRSAAGLEMWLRGHFDGIPINVIQFVPQWIRIPESERALLGEQCCSLTDGVGHEGIGTTVGEWLLDMETKFRVSVGTMGWEDFLRFLPGGEYYHELMELIVAYVPDWLQNDVEVKLSGLETHRLQVRLDGSSSRLGFTAGLFSAEGSLEDFALILDCELAA